jgi:hypothetical protein
MPSRKGEAGAVGPLEAQEEEFRDPLHHGEHDDLF